MQEQKGMGRTIFILLFSILTCLTVATLTIPQFLVWYAAPVMPQGMNCAPSIEWGIQKMLWLQLASVVVGALIGSFLAFKFRKKSPPSAPAAN